MSQKGILIYRLSRRHTSDDIHVSSQIAREIKHKTRRMCSTEEKIRIVLEGLCVEESNTRAYDEAQRLAKKLDVKIRELANISRDTGADDSSNIASDCRLSWTIGRRYD